MNKTQDTEFKKVSGQVFDPFKDSQAKNVFNNISISDDIAIPEDVPINQLVQRSRNFIADQRSDREIKNSLRNLG
jgi:hypothetical protein